MDDAGDRVAAGLGYDTEGLGRRGERERTHKISIQPKLFRLTSCYAFLWEPNSLPESAHSARQLQLWLLANTTQTHEPSEVSHWPLCSRHLYTQVTDGESEREMGERERDEGENRREL